MYTLLDTHTHKDTHICVALANLHNQDKQGWWFVQCLTSTRSFGSIQSLSCVWLFATPWTPCPSPTPGVYSNYVHRIGDAIQSSHPLLSPFPPAFNLSQHQGLFQWVSSSHQVARVLEFQLQHQSFQWIFRTLPFISLRNLDIQTEDTNLHKIFRLLKDVCYKQLFFFLNRLENVQMSRTSLLFLSDGSWNLSFFSDILICILFGFLSWLGSRSLILKSPWSHREWNIAANQRV